jgi:bifunctional non-homologous end joining protein LigD
VSRNGNAFTSFAGLADSISAAVPVQHAVLDGEIVCFDAEGRPQFEDLLFRRGEPTFVAFDLLAREGADLRLESLIDRKAGLRRLLAEVPAAPVLYADHVEGSGIALFEQVCALDLEGIVAKRKFSPYLVEGDRSPWVKIRNLNYSQWNGRNELFERDRHREPVPGWHACELECVQASGRVSRGKDLHQWARGCL